MRSSIKIISALIFVCSIAWFIADRSYEPLITGLGALATLIGSFITEEKNKNLITGNSAEDKKDEEKAETTQAVPPMLTKVGSLTGFVNIRMLEGTMHEVFYKKPFKRLPHLELRRETLPQLAFERHIGLHTRGTIEIVEQRKDGFKVKLNDYHIGFKWTAEGEFED
jgi:hypothetical protein